MFLGDCALLNKQRNQCPENGAKADDDCIGDAQSKALHGNAEQNLRDSPASTQECGKGKLLKGQASIRFEQTMDKSKGEDPGKNDKGDNAKNKPNVLPFPNAHKF